MIILPRSNRKKPSISSAMDAAQNIPAPTSNEDDAIAAGHQSVISGDSWDDQLREIEEAEKWEKSAHRIPRSLQAHFEALFERYAAARRILIYKLMDIFDWDEIRCKDMYDLFLKIPDENIDWVLSLIYRYLDPAPFKLVNAVFQFLTHFNRQSISELVLQINETIFDFIVNLIKHIPNSEIIKMAGLINESNFGEVLSMLEYCNEPMAKHCRLCRVRRMADLENKMIRNEIPDGMIRVPGALPIYSKKFELWSADDEKCFNFDFNQSRIYWNKELVDIIRICDNCLSDVNHAIASVVRFEPIHNSFYEEKKILLKSLHSEEDLRAILFSRISIERHRRRIRDFALRALESQRLSIKQAEERELRRQADDKRRLDKLNADNAKANIIQQAIDQDGKWKNEESNAILKEARTSYEYAQLKYHKEYDSSNPFKPIREHPFSWRLTSADEEGLAITKSAAEKRFGLGTDNLEVGFHQLSNWKVEAQDRHEVYLEYQARLAREKRDREVKEYHFNIEYVDQRLRRIEREKKTLERTLEREEDDRIERRKADRDGRRAARIAGYEANERRLMEIEDDRSLKYRLLLWEQSHELIERQSMFDVECDQCEVDRFWGFDLFEQRKREEEERIRAYYIARLEDVNQQLVMTKRIRPFKIEAALVEEFKIH